MTPPPSSVTKPLNWPCTVAPSPTEATCPRDRCSRSKSGGALSPPSHAQQPSGAPAVGEAGDSRSRFPKDWRVRMGEPVYFLKPRTLGRRRAAPMWRETVLRGELNRCEPQWQGQHRPAWLHEDRCSAPAGPSPTDVRQASQPRGAYEGAGRGRHPPPVTTRHHSYTHTKYMSPGQRPCQRVPLHRVPHQSRGTGHLMETPIRTPQKDQPSNRRGAGGKLGRCFRARTKRDLCDL